MLPREPSRKVLNAASIQRALLVDEQREIGVAASRKILVKQW
jgi:hypothetical protein